LIYGLQVHQIDAMEENGCFEIPVETTGKGQWSDMGLGEILAPRAKERAKKEMKETKFPKRRK
jgi:hypothetical protein